MVVGFMDVMTHVRLWAHLGWIVWLVTAIFMAYAARGKSFRVTHVPLGMAALALMALWFTGLLLTVKGTAIVDRAVIVPALTALEWAALIMASAWLAMCGSKNFRIEFRRNGNTLPLVLAWLALLFS